MDSFVDPSELIVRFVRTGSHMRPGKGRPHFQAFMPRAPDGEISVYRTTGLAEAEVIGIGAEYVGTLQAPLKGHCTLLADDVYTEGLSIEHAPVPHERHANVKGWSNDARNRIIARNLAEKSSLTVY